MFTFSYKGDRGFRTVKNLSVSVPVGHSVKWPRPTSTVPFYHRYKNIKDTYEKDAASLMHARIFLHISYTKYEKF